MSSTLPSQVVSTVKSSIGTLTTSTHFGLEPSSSSYSYLAALCLAVLVLSVLVFCIYHGTISTKRSLEFPGATARFDLDPEADPSGVRWWRHGSPVPGLIRASGATGTFKKAPPIWET